jgi:aspartyl-tRNA(Asn)/glutamyl-tRNA(Gln) amidotransferase subunit A
MPEELSPLTTFGEQIQAGEFTPLDVALQAQKNADDGPGNTYLYRDAPSALAYAAALPSKFPDAAGRPLLYGVPVSIKDCFDVTGTVTSCGSSFYAGINTPAAEDAWIVERLLAAGAIVTGKTHLHQLAYGITGENADYGDSLQPRDLSLLTGGSSSGAAASVLEGSAIIAVGTDTGGSVRVPAALCGLAGYRASHDLYSEEVCWKGGAHLAPSFDTLGLLFRDLRDGPLLGEAVFGLESVAVLTSPRIGFVGEEFLTDCDADVMAAYEAWKLRLQHKGATLEHFDTKFWSESMEIFTPIQASEAAAIHHGNFEHFEKAIGERLAWGASIPPPELAALHLRLDGFRESMARLLDHFDFLMLPCAPVSRLRAGEDQSGARARILRYTSPFSLAGLPTVTLPGEILDQTAFFGTGVQLAATQGDDAALLAFAAAL